MIERVKRWLASCGEDCESRVGKLERPSAGRTRNLRVFFLFAYSLSIVLSKRAKVNKAQEHRNDADRSRRHSVQNDRTASEKLTKNHRKIDQKRWKIDEKLVSAVSGRSGSFWVAPGSRGNALGTASGRQVGPSWPPSWPSWPPCWRFGAPSWQSRAPSWPSWVASGPLPIAWPA